MVRTLVIRQSFLTLNITLAACITAALGMLVTQWHRAQQLSSMTGIGLNSSTAAGTSGVGRIGERSAYNGIVENGLFGPAGRIEGPSDMRGRVGSGGNEPPKTGLDLKLWGVTSLSPTSPFGTASIEDRSGRNGSQLFHINDEVLESVTLEEIHPRWVLLLNRQEADERVERLSLDQEEVYDATDRGALTGALPAQR